eukprot:362866-Chlamydomonas_euryale.AAC.8
MSTLCTARRHCPADATAAISAVIHCTTASALSVSPPEASADTSAVHDTTSGVIPPAVISSKRDTARCHARPDAHAEIAAAYACAVGAQPDARRSSQMSSAACQRPPSEAARIAAVYACTVGAHGARGGPARIIAYMPSARSVWPSRAHASMKMTHRRESGRVPAAAQSSHT